MKRGRLPTLREDFLVAPGERTRRSLRADSLVCLGDSACLREILLVSHDASLMLTTTRTTSSETNLLVGGYEFRKLSRPTTQ